MRWVLWTVGLFGVAVLAATTLGSNDGLVSVYWGGWRADLSLNLFLLLMGASVLALMLASRATEALVSLPRRAAQWRSQQRERAAHRLLREAEWESAAGRFGRAQRAADRAWDLSQTQPPFEEAAAVALSSRWLAARAWNGLQDRERRDACLAQADALLAQGGERTADEGLKLWRAELALQDRQVEVALQLLESLPPGVARRTHALRLKLRALREAQRWSEALQTAQLLAKHQGLSEVAAQSLKRSLASQLIDAARDAAQWRQALRSLPTGLARDPLVLSHALRQAARLGLHAEGREWAKPVWGQRMGLSADERHALALALCDLMQDLELEWLPLMEQAQASAPHDAAVAAVAGLAFAARQLWGKARWPLEQAAQSPQLDSPLRRKAWKLLAQMARDQGDEARAQQCEQAALALP